MGLKGTRTTSDYLDFNNTLVTSLTKLRKGKDYKIGMFVILGINSGIRISDMLKLKHSDLIGDSIEIIEQKTGKHRSIRLNSHIQMAYEIYIKRLGTFNVNDHLFISQKGSVYGVRSINRLVSKEYAVKGKNISSHSLRKTFGRKIWQNNKESERSLIMLSKIFNHASVATTRLYLGIQQQEIDEIYLSI